MLMSIPPVEGKEAFWSESFETRLTEVPATVPWRLRQGRPVQNPSHESTAHPNHLRQRSPNQA
jgi:hypothetical protein